MLDLFGPYSICREVRKQTSGKAWGVLFVDMVSRAVHIEVIYGYDTGSFLMALSRFVSIRGWPKKIYSDPGSQLVAVKKELKLAVEKSGTPTKRFEWVFGTPDSTKEMWKLL